MSDETITLTVPQVQLLIEGIMAGMLCGSQAGVIDDAAARRYAEKLVKEFGMELISGTVRG